jgi:Ca2+-binding EF-hand superfamily protein
MSQEECRIGFAAIDRNRDGAIEFDEFLAWWQSD